MIVLDISTVALSTAAMMELLISCAFCRRSSAAIQGVMTASCAVLIVCAMMIVDTVVMVSGTRLGLSVAIEAARELLVVSSRMKWPAIKKEYQRHW